MLQCFLAQSSLVMKYTTESKLHSLIANSAGSYIYINASNDL